MTNEMKRLTFESKVSIIVIKFLVEKTETRCEAGLFCM